MLGLGDVDFGDDGVGVRMTEELVAAGIPGAEVAGTQPERCLRFLDGAFDHVLFIAAVNLGVPPGAATLLDAREIMARFPQNGTRRVALGALAKTIEAGHKAHAWLLAVQPASLGLGRQLTTTLQQEVEALVTTLCKLNATPAHRAMATHANR